MRPRFGLAKPTLNSEKRRLSEERDFGDFRRVHPLIMKLAPPFGRWILFPASWASVWCRAFADAIEVFPFCRLYVTCDCSRLKLFCVQGLLDQGDAIKSGGAAKKGHTAQYSAIQRNATHYSAMQDEATHRKTTATHYSIQCFTISYLTLFYITYVRLSHVALHRVALHSVALRYITLQYITLRYSTLLYVKLDYIAVPCLALHT